MDTSAAINPFQITKPVTPDDVINRDPERVILERLAAEGNNARLVAPRRFGKTSLLLKVQKQLRDSGRWTSVYVDLLGIVTLDEFSRRVERAYSDALKGAAARWFAARRRSLRPSVTAGGGPIPASATVDLSGPSKQTLDEVLDLPVQVSGRTRTRVHVVFDEFQEVLAIHDRIDAVVRSRIQHHGDAASYVFAGSQVHMLEQLFVDRRRAFFGQAAKVEIGRLPDDDLGQFIADRFEESGKPLAPEVLGILLDFVDGHPQRAMAAAHALWDVTVRTSDLETWDAARRAVLDQASDEIGTVWQSLSPRERKVLSDVATGRPPYRRNQGGSRGDAIAVPLRSLQEKGLITRIVDGKYVVVDPLLKTWIQGVAFDD